MADIMKAEKPEPMNADVPYLETIPISHPFYRCPRGLRVAGGCASEWHAPYVPILRKSNVALLNDRYAGGLILPDSSGRLLRLSLTRKEQISVRINAAHGKLTHSSALTNPRIWRR